MIRISKAETYGWEAAIRGMRNPMNSWDKSDSYPAVDCGKCGIIDREGICHPKEHDCSEFACYAVGENDLSLMKRLAAAGNDHGKFLRMINVTVDVEAPLYWWKEFDTYKVGTVANSCSTMHKIQAKEFTLEDFSTDHLSQTNLIIMKMVVDALNNARLDFLSQKDKRDWWQMIQLLPSSYNQKRTVQLNYAVLKNIYHARRNHKLDEMAYVLSFHRITTTQRIDYRVRSVGTDGLFQNTRRIKESESVGMCLGRFKSSHESI